MIYSIPQSMSKKLHLKCKLEFKILKKSLEVTTELWTVDAVQNDYLLTRG